MTRKTTALLTAVVAAAVLPLTAATATANVTATPITAKFSNNKLGAGTGGTFTVKVAENDQFPYDLCFPSKRCPATALFPPPSNHAVVHLPKGLKIDTKPFEKNTCSKEQIESQGANTCPRKAIIGSGTSWIGAVLGSQIVFEQAKVTAFAGPRENGKPVLNVYADARSPVSAQIVLHGVLKPDSSDKSKFGQLVDVDIPPIPTAPGSPDATILQFTVTLDGTVKVKEKGKTVKKYLAYLPKSCPKGGFQWKGDFGFTDGQQMSGTTTSPCPKS
jgi:ferredoxin